MISKRDMQKKWKSESEGDKGRWKGKSKKWTPSGHSFLPSFHFFHANVGRLIESKSCPLKFFAFILSLLFFCEMKAGFLAAKAEEEEGDSTKQSYTCYCDLGLCDINSSVFLNCFYISYIADATILGVHLKLRHHKKNGDYRK